jgi:KDO2-lipid IV(A) lauroyltransferase
VYLVVADRRSAAIENLTIAFGKEKSVRWIERTARRSFEHVGMVGVEFFRMRRWTAEEVGKKIVIDGRLAFNLAMMPGNEGICVVNAHFGCFEVMRAVAQYLGLRGHVIVAGLANPFLSRYLLTRGDGTGIKTHPQKGIVHEMIRFLRAGETVAFLADQRGDAERGVFVDYFGAPAPANEVFARFVIEGHARVLPLCTHRRDDGRYQCTWGEEITIHLVGDRIKDLTSVSQQFHNLFESWVRQRPEQGFWLQRKWRRRTSRKRSQTANVKQ